MKRKETLVAEVHGKENKNIAGDKKWGVDGILAISADELKSAKAAAPSAQDAIFEHLPINGIDVPFAGNTLEGLVAAIAEAQARASHQVLDGA